MKKIAILLDSTCDMSLELLNKYNLDYIKMGVTIGEETYEADLGWESLSSPSKFYQLMREGKRPLTNAISEVEFNRVFNNYLDNGYDVLYIGCSSALSSSVKTGKKVASDIMNKRTDCRILVVDPLISGMGQGLIGIKASEMRESGKSIDEIVAYLEENKLCFNQWGTVDNLKYLKDAGRVKASAAFFGNIIGIKPIIISDINGQNFAYKKVRGRKASLEEIINSVVETAVEPEENYFAITHADAEEEANYIKDAVMKRVKFKDAFVTNLGPILGASCGPKTLIAFNFGKKVTLLGE
jgi:DegV family protein with EDD domain